MMLPRKPLRTFRAAAVLLLAAAACADLPGLPQAALAPDGAPALSTGPGTLQYFGYVGNADDDWGLAMTRGYTNFAHVAARNGPTDTWVRDRVTAANQRGLKATVDLGVVFWCGTGYRLRCVDWQARWEQWKAVNAGILSPDKVLAFAVRDEPFLQNVNMAHYDEITLRVKADLPWARIWLFEAACLVRQQCGSNPHALASYLGTLPGVDWLAVGEYGIYPLNNAAYLSARSQMKQRFPGRQWIYVGDAFWQRGLHDRVFPSKNTMGAVARQWYDLARADPDAVLLGMFAWFPNTLQYNAAFEFPCTALREHVSMGRVITGKARQNTALPVGRLESITPNSFGATADVVGWATDPDGTACEHPQVDLYLNGQLLTTAPYPATIAPGFTSYVFTPASGTGVAWRFRATVDASTSGQAITAVARDLDAGSVTLPSDCPENPACTWTAP
jgi:hypothetical protein